MVAPLTNGSRLPRSEILMSLGLLGLLAVFLVPLPPTLLDLLLAFNISMTVLLLLVTLSVRQALDFAVFPSLLLILTLFRLALNVATTRLVLLKGDAGHIVLAFGKFVAGDNLVVGLAIFVILVVIQFVVITRGAGRISEVAARFVLDAMPGKQMAIDAEMSSGLINEAEAKARRQALVRESEFYGTMDGASKFVRGDAVAAVIITAVNLVGGMILGMMRGMSMSTAARTFSILTIGDGLVTQIPALLIATTAGILVTKASTQSSLGQEIGAQFLASTGAMRLGGVMILAMSLLPGLPTIPFLLLGGILFFLGRLLTRKQQPPAPTVETPPTSPKPTGEVSVDDFLQQDRIGLEMGARLVSIVEPTRGAGLVERIAGLRRDLAKQNGLWMPAVRIRDNIMLDPETYRILIGGREVARGQLRPQMLLAINPGPSVSDLPGEPTVEPAFGLPARWIHETDRSRAELSGCTVVDPLTVIITHLGEIVRRHAHELLSREDLKALVNKVRETSPAVVDELIPNLLTMGTLHRVLILLLEERVPISDLTRILESLANHSAVTKEPAELTERVRTDIGRAICDRFRDDKGRFRAIVLDPRLEMELRRHLQGQHLTLDVSRLEMLIQKIGSEFAKAMAQGKDAALLCDSTLRRPLRQALVRSLRDLAVIAYQEIPTDLLLEPVAFIRLEDMGVTPAKAA
jgi:flagellar biosynthesis protein FlhA